MAFQSYYWKKQAKSDIKAILKRTEISLYSLDDVALDKLFSEVEIKLFTLAYSVRKLADTKKLNDKIKKIKISVAIFPRNDKSPITPWGTFDDYYNLNKQTEDNLDVRTVCNFFIHAIFFQPVVGSKRKLAKLFFVSDKQKDKHIYCVSIKKLLSLFEKALKQEVKKIEFTYNPKKNTCKTELS